MRIEPSRPAPMRLPSSSLSQVSEDYAAIPPWMSTGRWLVSLRGRLTIAFLLIASIPIVVLGLAGSYFIERTVTNSELAALQANTGSHVKRLNRLIARNSERLEQIALSSQVQTHLRFFTSTRSILSLSYLEQLLLEQAAASPEVETISITDTSGMIVASSDVEMLGERTSVDLTDRIVVVPPHAHASSDQHDEFLSPEIRGISEIKFDGRIIGYVTIVANGNELMEIANSLNGLGSTGEILLLTRSTDGNLEYLTPLRLDSRAIFSSDVQRFDPDGLEYLPFTGVKGSDSNIKDYRGEDVFATWDLIEDADIGIITKQDRREVLAPVREARNFIIVFSIILGALVVVAALAASRTLTNPLNNLTSVVALFSRGDHTQRVESLGHDEFGQLGMAFNEMAGQLERSNADLEQQVRSRTEELQRSNNDLEQFAYVASHDLQEPLRMVASYTQLLGRRYKGQLDESADEFIGYAVDGAHRMQVLINDLLGYSRVGTHGGEFVQFEMNEAVDDVRSMLSTVIDESKATIRVGSLPSIVADRGQMSSLLQNLVSNAIKYRAESAPEIEIKAIRSAGGWQFSVADNGIGIDPQFSDRIFTIFQRLHTKEEFEGTGIGLAIAKRIVQRRGGEIWIRSELGKGSTFFFTIPDNIPGGVV